MPKLTVCTTYWRGKKGPPSSLAVSCQRMGIPLQEFGTRNSHTTFWKTKLIPFRRFLETVDTELVMFLDGNDTVATSGLGQMLKTYRQIADGRVLIGSELACWPYRWARKLLRERANAAGSQSPYCYVDTGLLMGPTRAVADIISAVEPCIKLALAEYTDDVRIAEDDVGMFILGIKHGLIDPVIDYGCQMICAMRKLDDWAITPDGKMICNILPISPHVIHCNGHRAKDRARLKKVCKHIFGRPFDLGKVEKPGYRTVEA